jgi:hypothetical protein
MRHCIFARPVSAGAFGMFDPTAAAGLVAAAGLA